MHSYFFRPIAVIASNTYKEIVRDRLLYGVLVVALLVTGSSFFLANISFNQNARVLQNVGLASIHVFTLFICVFVAATSMSRDVERRALYLLFPKPITRTTYVLGKYLGFVYLEITALLILGVLFGIGSYVADHSLLRSVIINLSFSFLEISFLTALTMLFTTFTAPLNAALYSSAFFIIGHSLTALKDYVDKLPGSFVHGLIDVCYYVLPNLEKYNVRTPLLYGLPLSHAAVAWSLVYWAVTTALVLSVSIAVMHKREV